MKRILKKSMALLLALTLTFMSFPMLQVSAYAIMPGFGYCGDPTVNDGRNVMWSFDNETSTLTIRGEGDMADYDLYNSPFRNKNDIIKIKINNGVTSIGQWAFESCNSLTSVIMPDSVTSIKGMAFDRCSSLTSITIPNSVTSICNSAFVNCSGLTSIVIPNSVTSIGDYAFKGCNSLTSIILPSNITSINYSAFEDCSSLTSITIPDSATYIGTFTFKNCSSLTSLVIPASVISIGWNTFEGCSNLTIKCVENSVAHKYAKDNNIKFELIDDEPTTPPTSSDSTSSDTTSSEPTSSDTTSSDSTSSDTTSSDTTSSDSTSSDTTSSEPTSSDSTSSDTTSSDTTSSDSTSSEPTQTTQPVATITKGEVSGTDKNGNEIKAGDIVVNDINEDKLTEKEKESVTQATKNPLEFISNALENIVGDITIKDEIKNLDKEILTTLDFVVAPNVEFPVKTAFKVTITDKDVKAVAIAHIKTDGSKEIVGYKEIIGTGDYDVDCLFNSASPVVLIAFKGDIKVGEDMTQTDSKPTTNPTTPATGGNSYSVVFITFLMLSLGAIFVTVASKKKAK